MFSIKPCLLPDNALLSAYTRNGAYTDCYSTEISGEISSAEYVTAFYTTFVFKLERAIIRWAVSKPSTDHQVKELAAGERDEFAAWKVESRSENQLLMCDFRGRTRSWLMAVPSESNGQKVTRLYFGSGVVPVKRTATDEPSMGFLFRALLGFHKFYSRVLLQAAKSRLMSQTV